MAYCTIENIRAKIGSVSLAELSNDVPNSPDPDMDVVNDLISTADTEIDSVLSGTYKTPFDPVPAAIRVISTNLACVYLMKRRFSLMEMPKDWKGTEETMTARLNLFANLQNALEGATVISPEADIESNPTVFDFNNPNSQMSLF